MHVLFMSDNGSKKKDFQGPSEEGFGEDEKKGSSVKEEPSFLRSAVIDKDLRYEDEPTWFGQRHIESFFAWASKTGASDITIQANDRIVLEIYGKLYRVTARKLTNQEVQEIVVGMYKGEAAKAILSGSKDMDFQYQIRPSRNEIYRYRVNATAIHTDSGRGIQITARTIPDKPPKLSSLGIEDDIMENLAPSQGMIVVTGATGSGKSTLLASIIRHLLEDPNGHRKILTYESPIEYVYDSVERPSSSISQTEIPAHLPSFSAGTRNALRRAPDVILVGEARDAESIGESVTASMTGHLLYTTLHSNGFADTIRRMVNVFPEGERNGRAVDIVSNLKMVISQRLVPSTDGKRVALREYVIFNEEIIDVILDAGMDNLTTACRDVLHRFGRSFAQDARQKFEEGRISESVLREIERGSKARDKDAQDELRRQEEKARLALELARKSGLEVRPSHSLVSSEPDLLEPQKPTPLAIPEAVDPIPGVLGADEMSHVTDPEQEPRLSFGSFDRKDEEGEE